MLAEVLAIFIAIVFWLWCKKTDIGSQSENPVTGAKTNALDSGVIINDDRDAKIGRCDEMGNAYDDETGSDLESPLSNVEAERDKGRGESDYETGSDKEVLAVGSVPCSTPLGVDVPNLQNLTRSLMVKEHERHKLRRHKPLDETSKETDGVKIRDDNSHNCVTRRGNNSGMQQKGDDSLVQADDIQIANGDVPGTSMNNSIIVDYHDRSGAHKQIKVRPSSDQQQRFLDRHRRRSLKQREAT